MAYLQVRDFPEELHDELRELAKREHRSVSQQTIIAIEQCVANNSIVLSSAASTTRPFNMEPLHRLASAGDQERIGRRQKVFEIIDKTPRIELPKDFPSVVDLIREGRDELDARNGL